MSNYRVREVLALGPMPDRQLRLLLALATWMTDESRVVQVSFKQIIETTGNAENTVKKARRELADAGMLTFQEGRGRGNKTTWTVCCLTGKGGSEVDPFPRTGKGVNEVNPFRAVDNLVKGVNQSPEKGSNSAEKRGQAKPADLQERDHWLNHRAKTSVSPKARAIIRAAVPDATDDEMETYIEQIRQRHHPDDLTRYLQAFTPATIANGITTARATARSEADRRPSAVHYRNLCSWAASLATTATTALTVKGSASLTPLRRGKTCPALARPVTGTSFP